MFGSPTYGRWSFSKSSSNYVFVVAFSLLALFNLRYVFQEHPRTSLGRAYTLENVSDVASEVVDLSNNTDPILAATLGQCPDNTLPNLILSAIDGPKWEWQIFIFMQSLEVALGRESQERARRRTVCRPEDVVVRIITPPSVARDLPDGFKALVRRYPNLEFVGALPDTRDELGMEIGVVLRRFIGWSQFITGVPAGAHFHPSSLQLRYNKILVCDLDVFFQRDPFAMPLPDGIELLYFPEWRGLKIGQCGAHRHWFGTCIEAGVVTEEQYESYKQLDRICAGTTYGTARAMAIYLRAMVSELQRSNNHCNDQALHIHLYYSGLLNDQLSQADLGGVWAVPSDEALLGTVGTTPIVNYNHWGEIVNEQDQVQHVIHQYKTHDRLSEMVWKRYGWFADLASDIVPRIPPLIPDQGWNEDHPQDLRYQLAGASKDSCSEEKSLCSCKEDDCQAAYDQY